MDRIKAWWAAVVAWWSAQSRNMKIAWGSLAVLACATLGAGLALATQGGGSSTSPKATTPAAPAGSGRILAVKVDNVGSAIGQQQGLNSAQVVYVEQVEGGLSRYLVIFNSNSVPPSVGPVRSARQTDIPILAAYGRVGLAYSGAISGLLPDLARANLVQITPASGLLSNGGRSPTYLSPAAAFAKYSLAPARYVGFHTGSASGGVNVGTFRVAMPAASFRFTWNGSAWSVSVDGRSPVWSAPNVIIQHVNVVTGKYTDYNAGHPDNEAFNVTTGSGTADFYRNGQVFHGSWSKPTDTSPTAYSVPQAPGRTWVVLLGAGNIP